MWNRRVILAAIATLCGAGRVTAETLGSSKTIRGLVSTPLVDGSHPRGPIGRPAADGAVTINVDFEAGRRPTPVIEIQDAGADWIQLGLVRRRPEWLPTGWSALHWGLSQQRQDGSFPEGKEPEFGTAWFVESLSRALLLSREFGDTSHEADVLPPLLKAARWIASHNLDTDPELTYDRLFTHRFWLYGAALAAAGQLCKDNELLATAQRFVARGAAAQRADGVNPERGGFDVGYQATGLMFAVRYAIYANNQEARDQATRMLSKGIKRLSEEVLPSGDVDASGSTRVGTEKDWYGKKKAVFYGIVVEAFGSYSYLTDDTRYDAMAAHIIQSDGFRQHFKME